MAYIGTKFFSRMVMGSFFFGYIAFSLPAFSQPVPEVDISCTTGDVECLPQGWSDEQRSWWYTVSQGSRLLPLSWALALKTEDGMDAMFGPGNLQRLGYLANPYSSDNPYGLPVGFVVDHDDTRDADLMCDRFPETCKSRTMREPWLGLNCSACHTTEITFKGRRFRVEGAPTLADFKGLVDGTENALRATLGDEERFTLFARQVLGVSLDPRKVQSLSSQVTEQLVWIEALRQINHGDVDAGPARLDAQGHILTKVSMINGATSPGTEFSADAPASYPFIWNTHQQKLLQWNGIAPSLLKIRLLGRATDVGALIRNVSEVIGVFAHIDAQRGWVELGYDSSVRVTEMVGLERLLSQLYSPVWPESILGPIDRDIAAQGRELFEANCRECHAHLGPTDLTTAANDEMRDLKETGTDVFLACNTYLRTTDAGNMAGQYPLGFFIDEKIKDNDAVHAMLVNAAAGAIYAKVGELISAIFSEIEPGPPVVIAAALPGEVLPGVVDPVKKERARQCLTSSDKLLAYKARPLNGIWATAPYLHNGSVPTLYDLLLPAKARNVATNDPVPTGELRPESFGVGSREFDPRKVGFVSAESENPWVFNVRDPNGNIIPGNSNAGHNYNNAQFNETQRLAIVEYLKGL